MTTKKDRAPRSHKIPEKYTKKGLIIVHTGEGKGKSTSAFGTALRSLGRGYKVAIVQFIKGKWKTGEQKALAKFGDQCVMLSMGKGFTWDTQNLEDDIKQAQKAWKKCCELLHDKTYHMVIFDEINYVMKYGFLDTNEIIEELKKKPVNKHVILTGRDAPKKLIKIADLVTEMKQIKHPYEQGIKAQPGIEY